MSTKKEHCVLWYSEKQRKVMLWTRSGSGYIIGILDDGQEVRYTQMMCGEYIDNVSNWSDAVCLGKGQFLRLA